MRLIDLLRGLLGFRRSDEEALPRDLRRMIVLRDHVSLDGAGGWGPTQESLDEAMSRTTRAKLYSYRMVHGITCGTDLLLDTGRPEDLELLRECLMIDPSGLERCCGCVGGLAIMLLDGDVKVAVLTHHHGTAIRLDGWSGDARLADAGKLGGWLSDRGIGHPRSVQGEAP